MKSFISVLISLSSSGILAQSGILLQGKVVNEIQNKPVAFAQILVLENKNKTRSNSNGEYSLSFPKPGSYTIFVRAEGYRLLKTKIAIKDNMNYNFTLPTTRIKGRGLVVEGRRDLQAVSRHSMTSTDIKEAPAGFGDITKSLSTLPGINLTGFFGSLIMRGAYPDSNLYLIDDIPILNPQHFNGLHTIISVDIVREVDVYPSAFPARYGMAQGGIISMNTVDEIKEPGGVVNIGFISANFFLHKPFYTTATENDYSHRQAFQSSLMNTSPAKNENRGNKERTTDTLKKGSVLYQREDSTDGTDKEQNGYLFVSGRYGYLSVLYPLLNEAMKNPVEQLPEYYDYQLKWKHYFNSKHSITLLLFGTDDVFIFNPSEETKEDLFGYESGDDPTNPITGVVYNYADSGHYQGFYYTFQPNRKFKQKLMAYSSLNFRTSTVDLYYTTSSVRLETHSNPMIFGLKSTTDVSWLNSKAHLKIGLEGRLFDYRANGRDLVATQSSQKGGADTGIPDYSNTSEYQVIPYDLEITNTTFAVFVENRFQFDRWVIVPGVRLDHLTLNNETTVDPRALISYEFPSRTIVSLVGGLYSSFVQTNMRYFMGDPTAAAEKTYNSEKSGHSSLGVEHTINNYTLKAEVFYNHFTNISYSYGATSNVDSDGNQLTRISSGQTRNYGFEVMAKKHTQTEQAGLFGWVSYAYTQAKEKTGVPDQSYKDIWFNSGNEEEHAVKLIAGYRWNKHMLSAKLSFITSSPYTKIVGDDGDPDSIGRYEPVYSDTPNTERFDPVVSLDLRYTFYKTFKWGNYSIYFELLNVLGIFYERNTQVGWRYDTPYTPGKNPYLKTSDSPIPVIPNFGIEAKF